MNPIVSPIRCVIFYFLDSMGLINEVTSHYSGLQSKTDEKSYSIVYLFSLLNDEGFFIGRVLIAYQNGLVILWDVSEDQIVFVGGGKDLQLKDGVVKSTNEVSIDSPEETLEHQLGDKEISALCWASSNGSILAVGYIDGDILFWNTSSSSTIKGQQALSPSNNVVKLRLSSAERRLPVIVLQWSKDYKSHNDCDGQLFIYGGDEIGSEEVLTVCTVVTEKFMAIFRKFYISQNGALSENIVTCLEIVKYFSPFNDRVSFVYQLMFKKRTFSHFVHQQLYIPEFVLFIYCH